jgi:hypothetical protein
MWVTQAVAALFARRGATAAPPPPTVDAVRTLFDLETFIGGGGLRDRAWLDLSRRRYAGCRFAHLVAAAVDARGLRRLQLCEDRLTVSAAEAIARSSSLGALEALELAGNALGDAGARVLATAPVRPTRLDLAGNGIGDDGARALAASPLLARVRELRLGGNHIGPAGVAALAGSRHLGQLTSLALAGNPIGDDGARALADAALPSLVELDLARARLTSKALWALAASPLAARLQTLTLQRNHLDGAGAAALATAPAARLEALGLAQNLLGDDGARALAGAHLPALRLLNVTRAGIGDDGAVALAGARWPRLSQLCAGNNVIGTRGAAALMATQLPLERLVLAGNVHDRGEARRLASQLRGRQTAHALVG